MSRDRIRRMSPLVLTLALLLTTRSHAYQSPVPQVEGAAEQDSYEIYSMLLRTELGPEWKITAWAITQQTQTFPSFGSRHSVRQCLSVSRDQEAIYLPLIEDYLAKNNGKQTLERKFDLPQYSLVDFGRTASIVFEVS